MTKPTNAAQQIRFNAKMVRALIEGRKTKARMPMKRQPVDVGGGSIDHYGQDAMDAIARQCPYGKAGDLLYVRETFAEADCRIAYKADDDDGIHCLVSRWTPSIHMPRSTSRITLEITSVRVERVQDISEEDAMAEGVTAELVPPDGGSMPHVQGFSNLWNSIYNNWTANPWVWVIEFKVHMINVDSFLRAA